MTRLYTKRQINEVLKELRIRPKENYITSQEAASVLTWRAKDEHSIEYTYTDGSVRRHVSLGNLKDIKKISDRQSLYSIDELFEIPLKPRHKKVSTEERLKC